jgi:hypothetical protein
VPFTTAWYWALIDFLCEVPQIQDPADVSVPDLDLGNYIDNINFAHSDSKILHVHSVSTDTLTHNFDLVKDKKCVDIFNAMNLVMLANFMT